MGDDGRTAIEVTVEIPKELEGQATDVSGWLGVADAWRIIDAAMAAGARGTDSEGEPPDPGTWR